MSEDLGEFPEDVRALIAADRRTEGPPAEVSARVLARLERGVLATAATGTLVYAAKSAGVLGFLGKNGVLVTALALLAGGATVVVATRSEKAEPKATPIAGLEQKAPIAALPSGVAVIPPPTALVAPTASVDSSGQAPKSLVKPPVATSAVTMSDGDLAAERQLLDRARAALGKHDPGAALAAVALHREKYPHGRMGEERDSLEILALAAAGRASEARARVSSFRKRYPNSIFLDAVENATTP